MDLLHAIPRGGQAVWLGLERGFDLAFGGANNPLRQLGTMAFLFAALLALSGLYLYAVLDTSASGAYRSVDRLSREQWYLGGVLRSLHRYAADAFVVLTLAHLWREWLFGRFAHFRRYTWLTGIPLLLFAFVSGIGGLWLNWDRLAQLSATASAEWLDAIPIFGAPLSRNFLHLDAVSDRFFSLLVFVHIGVALLLVYGSWFHLRRLTRPRVLPPRPLALGSIAALLALSWLLPVMSQGQADLATVPGPLRFDWFLLFVHPLVDATSAAAVWMALAAALVLLLALPLWPRPAAPPVAQVDPANCNGCRRCVEDCPYEAITMVAHPRTRPARQLASVDPARCASCGICAGSCPSSTPFRSVPALITGIDMPQLPVDRVRRRLQHGLRALAGGRKFVLFGCEHGARLEALAAPDLVAIELICTGMLPPSFVEYALRAGAEGVLVTGCRAGGCAFRFGNDWTVQRLDGRREPHLRASVPRERLRITWADRGDERALGAALAELRGASARLPAPAPAPHASAEAAPR